MKNIDLLRFTTAGSVDDGKSTLIGRLLYDTKSIYQDQLDAIEFSSKQRGLDRVELALLTDGLKSEREQGITIDVAYRYFKTKKRKFIIADTPGHIEYTRNMVTGASTANLALILVDARHGIVEQTKRHAFIASLLQIPHIIICVNKMDLVDYSESVFQNIVDEFKAFSHKLEVTDVQFIPVSALHGDNVVDRSSAMPWYEGSTLLYLLETIHIGSDLNKIDARFPVQSVIRPHTDEFHDYRGYTGKVAGGILKPGEEIIVLPSGLSTTIETIESYTEKLESAEAGDSVTITLADDVDISRGNMLARVNNQPTVTQDVDLMLCWLSGTPPKDRAKYYLRHTTNEVKAIIKEVIYKVDVNTLSRKKLDKNIQMNDIARVKLRTAQPIFCDSYRRNRQTGSIILIDEATNETVASGMII
ncbi:sulfate adenylyltransferase [Candidatus Uhrbacteria bacterium CG_4_10_14_0_2_um_filter_41_7]|uniref:sulfate adenylyltransferase n=1 Tax=Candidatus Uhrbacteria bacterium CG_4_9_14_3_um_filter_41_35 TaxID=1975034 RepID=A0A2M7XF54_9BACT|nr:MAG: sulfate adenylyltransferase [Candidatus Uhrbacteria bacterium CG11_big_fil_rev_8_21_14_0_20_41_9]PIZ52682.1 MAG: sulfate adenylyltransferase [Candidatus Uhrbacteria bacterium CG_4_10_14_0_2_um_filter_41_7]PJA46503.1 MAG: sulfate adenylyltransferase [Candidatus Uhrbacteria bacterium CG_4_9_14_3_um_filter_41_35]